MSQSLSGYLCGTHSRILRRGQGGHPNAEVLARAYAAFEPTQAAVEPSRLGARSWRPPPESRRLAAGLRDLLDVPAVVDLILYGSQVRGATTPYSDVDAILVVSDAAAGDPAVLATLRGRVLRAQRIVLEHQPMQHHAFEVATPSLLRDGAAALSLPPQALEQAATLLGRGCDAAFGSWLTRDARAQLDAMIDQLTRLRAWPAHPWLVHRLLSMFELVPALFLQSCGQAVAKWRSFDLARERIGEAWRPYDTLLEVRERWPRRRYGTLRALLRICPNPWVAMAVWRRAPVALAGEIAELLTPAVLADLHRVLGVMRDATAR